MIKSFVIGASYPFSGLRWLARPRLRRFVIIPLLLNTVLFAGAITWGIRVFEDLLERLVGVLPDWLDWLSWLLWPLFAVTALLLTFYGFTLIANLMGSPFNSLLAERVEDLARPGRNRSNGMPLWKEMMLAPLTELRKLAYFVAWAVPLLLLFVIPGINVASPFVWMAFSAWMLALQYADYPLGNNGLSFRDQRRMLRRRRPLVLGFGAAVLLITLIPVLNFLAMPASVIGATLMWVEQFPERAHPAR